MVEQRRHPKSVPNTAHQASTAASASTNEATEHTAGRNFQRPQLFIEGAIRNNYAVLEYCRTIQSAAGGMASGCLGLTGIWGFVFYFLCVGVQALCWHYKAGGRWNDFFATRSLSFTHSLVGGLFTYVLFWVFIYGIVHVY